MHRQTTFKLLYDVLYITINRKNEQVKHIIALKMSKYKSTKNFISFLHYIRMEPTSQNNDINAIQETRQLLDELGSNLSREEINKIREKLYKKEFDYNSLMEKEQKDSLTNEEREVLKNIDRYLKNISMHLKNLKKHFKKLQKYQCGLDYLFNEHNEEDYTSNNNINAF